MQPVGIRHRWLVEIDEHTARDIVQLVNCTVADGGTLGYEQPLTPQQKVRFIAGVREQLRSGDTHLLLGHFDRQPAFMALLQVSPMANCRHRAELAKGVVHPSYRGMRLVQAAFEQIAVRAESLGVEQLVLDVRENTRAHRLWQLFGFETYGVLDDYARANGIVHRGHYMAQTVASLRQRLAAAPSASTARILEHAASPT